MSIIFPAGSTKAVLEEPMVEKMGPATLTDYMVSSQGEHIAYTVSWTDYPHEFIERTGAPRLLRDIENGTLEGPDMLVSDQELQVQGMPARLNTHGFKSHPGRVRALWIVRGDRVYAVQVTTSLPAVLEAPPTREFFDSFRFVACAADSGAG
jgi:hypothetical protein